MNNFKLVDRMVIERPKIKLDNGGPCFMYDLNSAGISIKEFCRYLSGKLIDMYSYHGVVRSSATVCPWCRQMGLPKERYKFITYDELVVHIQRIHNKLASNLWELRMQIDLYRLLLEYVRNGSYDAISFTVQSDCQMCIYPVVEGREGKCAIPESSRNKPRSLRRLDFKCDGFGWNDLNHIHCAVIYQRRAV